MLINGNAKNSRVVVHINGNIKAINLRFLILSATKPQKLPLIAAVKGITDRMIPT